MSLCSSTSLLGTGKTFRNVRRNQEIRKTNTFTFRPSCHKAKIIDNMQMKWWNKRQSCRLCPLTVCYLPGGLPWKAAMSASLSKAQMAKQLSVCSRGRSQSAEPPSLKKGVSCLIFFISVNVLCSIFLVVGLWWNDYHLAFFQETDCDWFSMFWLWELHSCTSEKIFQCKTSARLSAVTFTVNISFTVHLVWL